MAHEARARGLRLVAITSLTPRDVGRGPPAGRCSGCTSSRTSTIDNGGAVGDAAIAIEGVPTRVAPTSTVVGAAIANALVAEVAERLARRGIVPEVFTSSNVAGGDAVNERCSAMRR